ncbi:MAG: class I SAM-dependent methyltransferase [Flavobacteriaceae bacterium]
MKTTKDILETNKKQKEFYNSKKKNWATRLWSRLREKTLKGIRQNSGMQQQYYELHKVWFGDLSSKKVLDLGCYAGNTLSLYLAENAKSYVGLDLSDVAIDKLNKRLEHLPNAKAIAADFLSEEFQETHFDLIYAYGVLHHFENTTVLIERLQEKLTAQGTLISYDPLETSMPIKILRRLYRPFQSDAAWEWPFTKKTYYQFAKAFHVEERRGILGKSKWIVLINMLPLSSKKKKQIAQKWHNQDWNQSAVSDKSLFKCMHVTMKMRKR